MLTIDFTTAIRKLIAEPPEIETTFYMIQKKKVRVVSVSKKKPLTIHDPEDWRIDDE